ncbi:MAG: MFS transporter [Actinobacteria bacterium]|nr:MFS transporter [Actinomycetota bacterium]MCL6105632.1 MFS transporter [Actinomycetota bacterium]
MIYIVVGPTLLVTTFLLRSSQNMAQTTFPVFGHTALHLSALPIGIIVTTGNLITVLVTAVLASKVSPAKITKALFSALLIMAGAMFIFAFSTNIVVYVTATVVFSIGGGIAFPSLITSIGQISGDQGSRVMGVFATTLSISLLFGPFIEAEVLKLDLGSLRIAFIFFGLFPLIGAFAMIKTMPVNQVNKPADIKEEEKVQAETPAKEWAGWDQARKPTHQRISAGIWHNKELWRNKTFRQGVTAQLVHQIAFIAVIAFGVLLAHSGYGMNTVMAEIAFGVFFTVSMLIRALLTIHSVAQRKLGLLWLSLAATFAGMLLIGFGRSISIFFLGMGILGIAHGATFPILLTVVVETVPTEELPRINAELTAVLGLVSIIVPFVLGFIAQHVGYKTTFLWMDIPIALLSIVFAILSFSTAAGTE